MRLGRKSDSIGKVASSCVFLTIILFFTTQFMYDSLIFYKYFLYSQQLNYMSRHALSIEKATKK